MAVVAEEPSVVGTSSLVVAVAVAVMPAAVASDCMLPVPPSDSGSNEEQQVSLPRLPIFNMELRPHLSLHLH